MGPRTPGSGARVVHVVRADHDGHVGGDVVQLRSSVAALQALGVDALASTVAAAPADVDVVHLYNLQLPEALIADLDAARRKWPGAPIAVSPVEWPVELGALLRARQGALAWRGLKTAAKQLRWWRASRRVLAEADLVLPNSDAEIHRLARWFRLDAGAGWRAIPNGVDLDRWPVQRRPAPDERRAALEALGLDGGASTVVACVARIEPWKNQATLVEALDRLPGAVVVLIGPSSDARYEARVRSLAAERPGRVALLGARTVDELPGLLALADVHVLPSFRETPGLASLEAAAAGCEVVVTDLGSAVEYLGAVAAVADPGSPGSIADAIADVVARPRQPAARAEAERYSWANAAARLAEAYEAVLAGSGSRTAR